MAFLKTSSFEPASPVLKGAGLVLRYPDARDYEAWASLRALSRDHLKPWEPTWAADELTRNAFRRRLRYYEREVREERGHAFFICAADGGQLLGGLTLSNIRRGVAQAATLGYWVGAPFAGRGVMTAAVRTIAPHAFGPLGLHRLEAACLPSNAASIRVLEKVGFVREGLARRYLKIDGRWQDHVLFAHLDDDRGA